MENDLIDNELNESPKDVTLGIIRWWEKKRWIFNLIMLAIVILSITTYLIQRPGAFEYVFGSGFFIQSFLYFLFINVCYCAGWGVQLLAYYYFKTQYDSNALDYVLFTIGSLFTGFITYAGYIDYLRY